MPATPTAAAVSTVGHVICCQDLPAPWQVANAVVVTVFDSVSALLNVFPANPITDFLSGALLLVRRHLFDQAPIVDPLEYKPMDTGEIDGSLNATDPEGDPIAYTLTRAPAYGTVTLDEATGSYTYTPGAGYDPAIGDNFSVTASNEGVYNILHPVGPPATAVTVTLNRYGSALANGQKLLTGEKLVSDRNGFYELRMLANGELAIFDRYGTMEWTTRTTDHLGQGVFTIMQSDGNLVVYQPDPSGTVEIPWNDGTTIKVLPLWSSGTADYGPTTQAKLRWNGILVVQNAESRTKGFNRRF